MLSSNRSLERAHFRFTKDDVSNRLFGYLDPKEHKCPYQSFAGGERVEKIDDPYARTSLTIEELENYRKAVTKVKKTFRASKNGIIKISKLLKTAPAFSQQDLLSTLSTDPQVCVENKSQIIARTEWWILLPNALKNELKNRFDSIAQDAGSLHVVEEIVNENIQAAIDKYFNHKRQEKKEEESQQNTVDLGQLIEFEKEVQENEDALKEEQTLMSKKISMLKQQILSLKKMIEEATWALLSNQSITVQQFSEAKDRFDSCTNIGKWIIHGLDQNNVIMTNNDEGIYLRIDKAKIFQHDRDAVLINNMPQSRRDDVLDPVKENLFYGLQDVKEDKWDMNEIMQDVFVYYSRFLILS